MPTISNKALSAIEAVVYIACRPGQPVRGKAICDYQGVAERYLEPVMQELVHQKILRGVRGPKGGYVLSKEKRKITLKDIVQICESLETRKRGGKSPIFKEIILPIWKEANSSTMDKLKNTTIQDLFDSVMNSGVIDKEDKPDFNI
jgi:Rrf2 family protein